MKSNLFIKKKQKHPLRVYSHTRSSRSTLNTKTERRPVNSPKYERPREESLQFSAHPRERGKDRAFRISIILSCGVDSVIFGGSTDPSTGEPAVGHRAITLILTLFSHLPVDAPRAARRAGYKNGEAIHSGTDRPSIQAKETQRHQGYVTAFETRETALHGSQIIDP